MISPNRQIRILRQDISYCEYELYLVVLGIRRRLGAKKLKEIIATKRAEIKMIEASKKQK